MAKCGDLFLEANEVWIILLRKIQEESLQTCFTYSSTYDYISMETLVRLNLPTVHAIISKIIINEELMASLDQPTRSPVTNITWLCKLAEKLSSLVENNEWSLTTSKVPVVAIFETKRMATAKTKLCVLGWLLPAAVSDSLLTTSVPWPTPFNNL